jgi:hypothetical protein
MISCPCRYTTPCGPRCTCVNPISSTGCTRCCSYGPIESQRAKAKDLARRIDSHTRLVDVVRASLFAEDYAKADERGAQRNAPDELTAKDIADGYHEGYVRLHDLVSKLWAAVEKLPDDLLSAARLGERSPTDATGKRPKALTRRK